MVSDILQSTDCYNPANIAALESYVASQASDIKSNPYNFEANRTLVKLYQFFPENSKVEYQLLATLLSLIFGSETDVGTILCLIPESVKSDSDDFTTVMTAAENRDSCLFPNFIDAIEALGSSSLSSVASFAKSQSTKDAIRSSVLQTLSLAYKTISTANVLKQLKLGSADEIKALATDVVESADGSVVAFADNEENTSRKKSDAGGQTGSLDYASVRSLISSKVVAAAE